MTQRRSNSAEEFDARLSSSTHLQCAGHSTGISPGRQPDQPVRRQGDSLAQALEYCARRVKLLFRVLQMREFLLPDRKNDPVQFEITVLKKVKLIVEMPMHGSFDGSGAGPYAVSAETRRQKSEDPAAIAPEMHHAARSGLPGRHGSTKNSAVITLVVKHFCQRRAAIRPKPAGHDQLRGIDSDRPELTGMIDPHDARNRERVARIDR